MTLAISLGDLWTPESYGGPETLLWERRGGVPVSKNLTGRLTMGDKEVLVGDLKDWFRTHGFPYPRHGTDHLRKDFQDLAERDLVPVVDTEGRRWLPNKTRAGMDLVQEFSHRQFYGGVRSPTHRSMVEAFEDDKTLLDVLRNRVVRFGGWFNIHGAMLRQGFRSTRSSAVVSTFNCLLAKWVIKTWCPPGGQVYDLSMGFGHRLVGCLGAGEGRRYLGVDPWRAQVDSARKITSFLGKETLVSVEEAGSERFLPPIGSCNLVFSSPPYWTKEIYGGPGQSISEKKTKGEWLRGWWEPTLQNLGTGLIDGGYLILNISEDLKGLFQESILATGRYELVETLFLQLSQSHFAKVQNRERRTTPKGEPILVFQKRH